MAGRCHRGVLYTYDMYMHYMWSCTCGHLDEAEHRPSNAPLFSIRATMPASTLPRCPMPSYPAQGSPSLARSAGHAEISIKYNSGHTLRTSGNHEHLAVWLHTATMLLGHGPWLNLSTDTFHCLTSLGQAPAGLMRFSRNTMYSTAPDSICRSECEL